MYNILYYILRYKYCMSMKNKFTKWVRVKYRAHGVII